MAQAMCRQDNSGLTAASKWFEFRVRPRIPAVPSVDTETLATLLKGDDGKVTLVDCREEREISVSRMKNAVPLVDFKTQEVPQEGPIVFYCTIGGRSAHSAQQYMEEHPNTRDRVKNYELSLVAWTHGQGELVDSAGNMTNKVHSMFLPELFFPPSGWDVVSDARDVWLRLLLFWRFR
eukprot:GEMP01094654.1.p1 GENE.GEMP01094654.1~~GEMP01094654.1.p1  ORF type:complete len:178 (+),score=31.93 GEMP01094654.1:44-577(+)